MTEWVTNLLAIKREERKVNLLVVFASLLDVGLYHTWQFFEDEQVQWDVFHISQALTVAKWTFLCWFLLKYNVKKSIFAVKWLSSWLGFSVGAVVKEIFHLPTGRIEYLLLLATLVYVGYESRRKKDSIRD